MGIRYKKQILVTRDTRSGTFYSHMFESAYKKKHFLAMFGLEDMSYFEEDFQLQQLCPSNLDPEGLASFALMMGEDLEQLSNEELFGTFCGGDPLPIEQKEAQVFLSTKFYKPKHSHIHMGKQELITSGGI